jgi:hypothetical protein
MARPFGRWLTVLALVLVTGGHWMALQSVAWAGMLIRYSQQGSVSQAILRTFDGQHPCRLCKVVREGRAEEQRQDSHRSDRGVARKLDLLPVAVDRGNANPWREGRLVVFGPTSDMPLRFSPPHVPPPRVDL